MLQNKCIMKTPETKPSEIETRADFSYIRYAQCWEDTEVLLGALDIKPADTCLSIASAGDNSLAMLAAGPKKVTAIDLNPAQLALAELKLRAIEHLDRASVLELLGYSKSNRRTDLYLSLLPYLTPDTVRYFNLNKALIEKGLAGSGKFERYFAIFRNAILPLLHSRCSVESLVTPKTFAEREEFFEKTWNNLRFRLAIKLFFSNAVIGFLGRDPSFFKYVDRSLPEFLSESIYKALVIQDPAQNPYLHWILFGEYRGEILPFFLRAENFEKIKANANRLELKKASLEEFLEGVEPGTIDCFNLSDVFEYVSEDSYRKTLDIINDRAGAGARLAYWNMLAPRTSNSKSIKRDQEASSNLYAQDKTFFYTSFNREIKVSSC